MLWLMRDWEIRNSQEQRIFLTHWIRCILRPNLDLQRSINAMSAEYVWVCNAWVTVHYWHNNLLSPRHTRGRDWGRWVVWGGQAILLLLQTQTGHCGQIIPVLLIAGIMTISNNLFLVSSSADLAQVQALANIILYLHWQTRVQSRSPKAKGLRRTLSKKGIKSLSDSKWSNGPEAWTNTLSTCRLWVWFLLLSG